MTTESVQSRLYLSRGLALDELSWIINGAGLCKSLLFRPRRTEMPLTAPPPLDI